MTGELVIRISGDSTEYEKDLAEVDKKADNTEKKVHLTVEHSVLAMRMVLDSLALMSAATGETIDVSFLMMISMMTAQMKSLAANIAVSTATPGMQPFAILLATLIPMITSAVMFSRQQQMKAQEAFAAQREADLDNVLNVVSYNG